ncbi:cysteine desulfurase family protein [Alkalibacter mobilis]|uniref:cysteine desulfurase family protein n=1 Tax=Alkalibacter mobilis TaxID=2787712 RepID=UPI00189FA0AA|nr:cysteine desulfurase family protein [Alkalibacter mobilis]MBF7096190.1 cysteine desulfurase [Alkalibacter mobilis]
MIYLDYGATTPVDELVLEEFVDLTRKYPANPNSGHDLGRESLKRIEEAKETILKSTGLEKREIVFTSGASEANNLAILGYAAKNSYRGKHIITTYMEHSSVIGPLMSLKNRGFEVDFVEIGRDGRVDLENLEELMDKNTIMVSIGAVESETGVLQDIDKISEIIKRNPDCMFHVDATQAMGKVGISLDKADMITFSAHKFYGINGCGALVKKDEIILEPMIYGGLSLSPYRSGTPSTALIATMAKALELSCGGMGKRLAYIRLLNEDLRKFFKGYKGVLINSTENSLPHFLNFSVENVKGEDMVDHFGKREIYFSAKSACSAPNTPSKSVYAVWKDKKRALSSVRICLSHLTTEKELKIFKNNFDLWYKDLR